MKQLGVPMTASGVIQQIPKLLLPFNFAKALMNSALAMVLLPDACGPVNTMKSLISISQAETGPKLLIVSFGMTFFSYFIQVVPEY